MPTSSITLKQDQWRVCRCALSQLISRDSAGTVSVPASSLPNCPSGPNLSVVWLADVTGAELDCLRDHAIAYERLLAEAGVSVGLRVWRGAFHAFMTFLPQAVVSETARQDHLQALREVF